MNEKDYESKWHTVRESYLRMLIGKAMKYDILMDEESAIEVNSEDFYGEIYRGLTGEKLLIPNDQAHFIKRVNYVNGEIIRQTDETLEGLDLAAKKHGFE